MKAIAAVTAVTVIVAAGSAAHAVCIYNGVLNARTSVTQEFRDSKWVVRANVLSAKDHWLQDEEPWTDSWTIYNLQVEHAYKGGTHTLIRFYTGRNSGGFYLDNGASHDIGGEYLLFLDPNVRGKGDPPAIIDTVSVNYPCGQSKPWREVSPSELRELAMLSRK